MTNNYRNDCLAKTYYAYIMFEKFIHTIVCKTLNDLKFQWHLLQTATPRLLEGKLFVSLVHAPQNLNQGGVMVGSS